MKRELILTIDRVEGDRIVAFDEGENEYLLSLMQITQPREGGIFLAEVSDGEIRFVRYLEELEKSVRSQERERLQNLFKRRK